MSGCTQIGTETSTEVSDEPLETVNLAKGAPYYYECGVTVSGDPAVDVLTDGDETTCATITASLGGAKGTDFTANDWYGASHQVHIDNSTGAISVDLGFICNISGAELVGEGVNGFELFYSTDGYNYTYYAGKFDTNSVSLNIKAKALMFVFDITDTVKLGEIVVWGTAPHQKVLLSTGASYVWEGKDNSTYKDDGTKLTDGKLSRYDGEDAVAAKMSSEKDDLTGKAGNIITFDLGEIKNVSELSFGIYRPIDYSATMPTLVNVRYSADGTEWSDLGQSYLRTNVSGKDNCSNKYCVTRADTVKARYVKLYTYMSSTLFLDEVSIYGCEHEVSADLDHINKVNQLSNSNVASFKTVKLGGASTAILSDLEYSRGVSCLKNDTLDFILDKQYDNLVGAAVTATSELTDVTVEGASNVTTYALKVGSRVTTYIFFDAFAAKEVKINFACGSGTLVTEAALYDGQAQLPTIRGGFYQLTTAASYAGAATEHSAYMWYLQLKGMKDLGQDYVVIQYSIRYLAKTTLINGKRVTAAGYTYTGGYGTEDVCEAILDAADKLGMKVWLGTICDADFTDPIGQYDAYDGIVADALLIIDDINEMYAHHESFAGYYLSDEECDQWLNMNGGVAAGRKVYQGQSERIREINPDARIMISPAIWRSGDPQTGADNLYKLIVSDTDGGRPLVDIVAAQDCLGREQTLTVSDAAYDSFENYCSLWAKAVRRAGAEFWHDAEVFEITSTSKNYDDLIKSLATEAKISGSIIVFDTPHYMPNITMTAFNDSYAYYKRLILRDYIRYYSGFAAYDRVGENAEAPWVVTDDGRTVERDSGKKETSIDEATKHDTRYNDGVLTAFGGFDKMVYQDFALGNGAAKPMYALAFDSDNLYIAVKTNDTTANYQDGTWWNGKDDLVQIWMTGTGVTTGKADSVAHGVRMYLHRRQTSWVKGGEAGEGVNLSKVTYSVEGDTAYITVPFAALGITPPTAGDGSAIGIVIQYIDGADLSWASSNGSKGTGIDNNALYSY